ncbi:MAG: SDR family NAD(P)-dependent oxidoreductase [Bryobacteraceae bacterium]|jgi:NAD(P)-dependent dehydrogenase (short-subunit alcohol dehydrogenase family)
MTDSKPVVLITGAGSGLGLASALLLASRDFRVYGTVFNDAEEQYQQEQASRRNLQICPLRMDVTNRASIDRGVDTMVRESGRIDAVVHFAGMGLRGFFEDLSMQEIRQLYDVNVFGIMEVTQAVLPHMRERRSGRIVIVASAAGRMGEMSIAGYSSGKFAVVGLGECLRQEMALLNIDVSVLEPGLIYTPHFGINRNRARRSQDPSSPYYFWFCQHEALVDKLLAANKFTAEDIAGVVYKILTVRKPRLHYMVGWKLKFMVKLRDILPFELYERIHQKIIVRMVAHPSAPATGLSGLDAGISGRVKGHHAAEALSKAHD